MPDTPFFGSAYASRSTNYADNRLVNLYPEVSETRQGKNIGALYLMPGIASVATPGTGPITAAHVMAGTGYVISNATLFSVAPGSFTTASLGTVASATPAASMIDNGTQLGILCGNSFFVYSSGGGLVTPTLPFTPSGTLTYQDGFGLACASGTNELFQSNLLDLTTWNALAFGSASGDSDNLVTAFQNHRELYLLKQFRTEVWVNAGTQPFAFQRLDGAYMQHGCASAFSVARVGENFMWVAQNEQGQGIVVELQGIANPVRISDFALENEIQGYTLSNTVAYGIQFNGHSLYVLHFPSNNVTWVYDKTVSDLLKRPTWFQWLSPALGRHNSNCFMNLGGALIVGDYSSQNLFKVAVGTLTDATLARTWIRTWRALEKPSTQPVRFSTLTIDMETGNSANVGNPSVSLRWSDDGGHTYSPSVTANVGAAGSTTSRVFFTRIGSTRRSTGLDRIFELSSSSVFPAALINAVLE